MMKQEMRIHVAPFQLKNKITMSKINPILSRKKPHPIPTRLHGEEEERGWGGIDVASHNP